MSTAKPFRLPIFLGIILPLIFILCQIGAERVMTLPQKEWLLGENGPHEYAEFIILVIAAAVAARIFLTMDRARDRLLTAWVVLALICCLYVGGEEISWGQQIFAWQTPDTWSQINDQNETNLHNTSAWFDQKPRLILEIGIIIGGILLPLYRRFKPNGLPARFDLFYPTNILVPLAVIATATKQSQTLAEFLKLGHPFHRVSEVQELLFFMFVLVYLLILKERIAARDARPSVLP